MLSVRLLGRFELCRDDVLIDLASRPAQSLLAFLLLNPGKSIRREQLAGLFWPEASESNARNNLRHALWRIRKELDQKEGATRLEADSLTVAYLPQPGDWLDVRLLQEPLAENGPLEDLQRQVEAYQGELLPGFYDEWVILEREHLQSLFNQKIQRLVEGLARQAQWEPVITWCRFWIQRSYSPEPAYRMLMLAHAAQGDIAAAAAAYQRCVETLRQELGVEPSLQTEKIYQALARGEALDPFIPPPSPVQQKPTDRVPDNEAPFPGDPPFKGLQHYEEADAARFFGREEEVGRLKTRVEEWPFLALIGASGSGKSSLLRAGLLPELRKQGWHIRLFTPTADPLESLAQNLNGFAPESKPITALAALPDGQADSSPRADRETESLVLVVDQFEELFSLCRKEEARQEFITRLLAFADETERRGLVIIALRADFYAHCSQYERLREALARYQEYIGPMSAQELRSAIEKPAQAGGWEFEPGLVDLLMRDIGNEPGGLPLLSHALLETWNRRQGVRLTLAGYAASGGVHAAIARTAEQVYRRLSPNQQRISRNIFLRLTELNEGAGETRRRVGLEELLSMSVWEDGQPSQERRGETEYVLNTLVTARLVTTEEHTAEVAHEALIREWPTLRNWLQEDRQGLILHRHLTESAQGWEERNRDPSELYRGSRMAQTREWAAANEERLNTGERAFIAASIEHEQHEALEREAQRLRELEASKELAETKSRAANQLRKRAIFLTGAFMLAIVLAGVAILFGYRANRNATEAQSANRIATSRELAGASLVNLNIDPERSTLLALQAEAQADTFQAQDALHRAVQTSRLLKRARIPLVWCYECPIAFSPDGTRLENESRDADGQLITEIRDAVTLEVLFTKPGAWADDRWLDAGFLPIAAPSADGSSTILTVWDATGQKVITTFTFPVSFDDVALYFDISPDRTKVAAVENSDRGDLSVYDIATHQRLPVPNIGKPDYAYNGMLRFSPDSRSLLTIGGRSNAILFDVSTGGELLTVPMQGAGKMDFSPDGKRFAMNEIQFVRIVDIASGQEVVKLSGHTGNVENGLQFNADGTKVVTVAGDGTTRIWDAATGQSLLTVFGDDARVISAAFSPDGTRLATISEGSVQTWSIAQTDPHELLAVPAVLDCNCVVAFSPDGLKLADFGGDQTVKIMESRSGKTLLTLPDPGNQGRGLAFSPDGTRLATSGADNLAHVWDLGTGKELMVLASATAPVDRVTFSPDGSQLATIDRSGEAHLWNAISGQVLFSLDAFENGSIQDTNDISISFSPDGSHLVTAGGTFIKIWDVATGQATLTVPLDGGQLAYAAAFSPDGKRLAVSYRGGSVNVLDAASGQKLFDLSGHTGSVRYIAYSPDGTRIATASVDGTARLWDAVTGFEQFALTGHTGQVTGLAFSPDGARLATDSRDGTLRVYALHLDDLIKIAQSRLTRSLTLEECQKYLHLEACPAAQ